MAAKPLTTEAIALTEKKVDMSLDDIIKMSKKNTQKGKRPLRVSNKNQGFQKVAAAQRNSKVQRFMDSRASVRQGVLAQRRTNFRANQFSVTTEVARKAVVAPSRNRVRNWIKPRVAASAVERRVESIPNGKENTTKPSRPQTLDARFASMKQERMRVMNQQVVHPSGNANPPRRRPQQPRQRGRGGGFPVGAGRRLGNF